MSDEWGRVWEANRQAIIAHPNFPKLVRAVATAEVVTGRPWRLRNSPTRAAWRTRGSDGRVAPQPGFAVRSRRALRISLAIADDLNILPQLPDSERRWTAYGIGAGVRPGAAGRAHV